MRLVSAAIIVLGFSAAARAQENKPKEYYALVYEIAGASEKKDARAVDLSAVAKNVRERLDLLFSSQHDVIPHDGTVEILIADADATRIAKLKQIMEMPCVLEFRILANKRDHETIIDLAQAKDAPAEIVDPKNAKKVLATWVKFDETKFPKEQREGMILRSKNEKSEVLVVTDEFNVRGSHLEYARVATQSASKNQPWHGWTEYPTPTNPDALTVDFGFSDEGAKLFGDLTARNVPDPARAITRRLGMILDGTLFSAPNINARIGARGQITGHFTEEEVKTLVAKMKSGPLPAPLKLVKEGKVEAK